MLSNAIEMEIWESSINFTDSNTSHHKIAKQRIRDKNIWKKYEEKGYTENISINSKNFEKVEKKSN